MPTFLEDIALVCHKDANDRRLVGLRGRPHYTYSMS